MKIKIYFLLFPSLLLAQFGPPHFIDISENSGGVTKIITADLNNNGLLDIITSRAYQYDNITFYENLGEGNFSAMQFIEGNLDDPITLASGDFNNNGWTDIVTMTQTNGEIFWYPNTNGSFSERIMIDEGIFFGNGIVAGDFDNNGSIDLVAIGQHSIDLYRNDGNGNFTKEHILTTDTSPNVLECLYIETVDINNNGNLDLVVAETLGGVIYFNDGTGSFTPEVFSTDNFIATLVHTFDANGNGLKDIVLLNTTGALNLYINEGDATMTFSSTLKTGLQNIKSMQSFDANGNGLMDLFTAVQKPVLYFNDTELSFTEEYLFIEDSDLFVQQIAIANLDEDQEVEAIWTGLAHSLAYHKNSNLNNENFEKINTIVYPVPFYEELFVSGLGSHKTILKIFTLDGKIVFETKTDENEIVLPLEYLKKGAYLLDIQTTGNREIKRIIKN